MKKTLIGMNGEWEFMASKQDILINSLTYRVTISGIVTISDGNLLCRAGVKPDGSMKLMLSERINYDDLDWGNYERHNQIEKPFSSFAKLSRVCL